MNKETFDKLSPRSQEIWTRVEKNIRHDIEVGLEYGFDLRLHWKEMLESLEEEKVEIEEVNNRFERRLAEMNDSELITAFNREVGNFGWTISRGQYLTLMHKEFNKRGFDYSSIGDSTSISFKEKIVLIGKKIKKEKGQVPTKKPLVGIVDVTEDQEWTAMIIGL